MRTQPWVLASALALVASVASAQPDRPRIYYPRAIRRQIANSTTDELPEPASTTTIQSSTRRGLLDDLIDGVIGSDSTSSTSSSETTTTDEDDEDEDETSGGGIIIGPTGIKIPGLEPRPTSSTESDSAATPSDTPTATSDSSSASSAASSSASAASSSSSKLIDLDPIISAVIPDPETTTAEEETPTTTSATGSGSSASSSSSSSGLLDDLTSLLPPPASETTTGTEESSTSVDDTPTSSTLEPLPTPTPLPPPEESTTDVSSSTLEPLPEESTTSGDVPSSTGVPPIETPIVTPSEPTASESTDLPVSETTDATEATDATDVEDISTASETTVQDPVATPTVSESTADDEEPIPTPKPEPSTFSKIEPSKVISTTKPTATDDDEDAEKDWLPTTIVQEATTFSFSRPTAEPTGTTTSMPTNIPKVILPDEADIVQPEGTTAIQIGFLYPLNWGFVYKNSVAAAQLFRYLPEALAYAAEIPTKNIVVTKLVPIDTTNKWGYLTTVAKLYYPTDRLDSLQMQLGVANSRLYNNDKNIVNSLTSVINRNIDIFGNIEEENGDANRGDGDGGKSGDDTFDDNDDSSTSASDRARTAGIAVGALSLAGLYGAAMFIVARRYKRKRQGHQRASSLTSSQASSEMRYNGAGSPALMGGALLSRDVSTYGGLRDSHNSGQSGPANSARTAGISAPVATENSLGWN